jgi:hypothetical protein
MIPETQAGFRVERTDDLFTSHAGLPLVVLLLRRLGGEAWERLPRPRSNRGIAPEVYVEMLAATLAGGGAAVEETRVMREDKAMRRALGWKRMPKEDAVLKWLERMGREGLGALDALGLRAAEAAVRAVEGEEAVVDLDATFIESHKKEAKYSYLEAPGYMPLVAYARETGACVWWEFREGNAAPQAENTEAVKELYERLTTWGKTMRLCSDSAGYQAQVINFCEEKGIAFVIAADQDPAVREAIRNIPAREWRAWKGGEDIAETVHTMNETKEAFRLVVVRKPNERPDLFEREKWVYFAVATNEEAWSAEEVKFSVNAAFFSMGVLTFNAVVAMKRRLFSARWWKKTAATLRWEIGEAAGRWVRHARGRALKVAGMEGERWEAFRGAYEKVWAFSP